MGSDSGWKTLLQPARDFCPTNPFVPFSPRRYAYTSWRPYARAFTEIQREHADARGAEGDSAAGPASASLPASVPDLVRSADDAFATIMAWLYGRIPATR